MSIPANAFNLSFNLSRKDELLSAIDAATPQQPVRVATPNPEIMLAARRSPRLANALASATHCIVDGFGLLIGLKVWSLRVKALRKETELYHGSDLVADLFARYANGEKSFYFLGGAPGLAAKAATQVQAAYPGLRIVGAESGGIVPADVPDLSPYVLARLRSARPDILLIGLGAPKQEIWMDTASRLLDIPVMAGIGGSLAFFGSKQRAPKRIRSLGMEWLYRAFKEKGHWRRLWQAVIVFPLSWTGWMLTHAVRPPQSSGQSRS